MELLQSNKRNLQKNPAVNIILNGETLNISPSRLGKNRECLLSDIPFNIVQQNQPMQ